MPRIQILLHLPEIEVGIIIPESHPFHVVVFVAAIAMGVLLGSFEVH